MDDDHDVWRELRRTCPVREELGPGGVPFRSFYRHAECQEILRAPGLFSSTSGTLLTSVGAPDPLGGHTLATTDPPRHAALRRPSTRALGPVAARAHADGVHRGVRELLEPVLAGGVHDVAVVLRRLPMIVAGPMLGLPETSWERAVSAATATIAPRDPLHADGDATDTVLRASAWLFGAIREALTTSLSAPDTLPGALSEVSVEGAALTRRQITANVHSALIGGSTATLNTALHLLLHLARTPDLWHEVAEDRSLVPGLVDEAARWTTPARQLVRRVTADVELAGAHLRAGDWVVAWLASANWDETVFADPDRFDPRRAPNPHLAFGFGPHFCVGAAAGRTLLGVLVNELADSGVRFELAGRPRRLVSAVVNGITSLPMRFTP